MTCVCTLQVKRRCVSRCTSESCTHRCWFSVKCPSRLCGSTVPLCTGLSPSVHSEHVLYSCWCDFSLSFPYKPFPDLFLGHQSGSSRASFYRSREREAVNISVPLQRPISSIIALQSELVADVTLLILRILAHQQCAVGNSAYADKPCVAQISLSPNHGVYMQSLL